MAPAKAQKLPSPERLQAMAEELVAAPRAKANHLPLLLASLASEQHQARSDARDGQGRMRAGRLGGGAACTSAAPLHIPPLLPRPQSPAVVHQLKLFFVDAFASGELGEGGRAPGAGAGAAAAGSGGAAPPPDPSAVYGAWLSRQYAAFLDALLALLRGPAPAAMQAAALQAGMECVRGEAAGRFANLLYVRLLAAALTSAAAAPEVLALLIDRRGRPPHRAASVRCSLCLRLLHAALLCSCLHPLTPPLLPPGTFPWPTCAISR